MPRSLALGTLAAWMLAFAVMHAHADAPHPATVGALLARRDTGEPDLDALSRRIDAVAARPEATGAHGAVDRARRALAAARALRRSGDEDASARKTRIARAALARAEAVVQRAQAQHELDAAKRRAETARADALQAREARTEVEQRLTRARTDPP